MHAQGAKWPKCGVLHRFSGLFADVGRNSGAPDRFFAEMTKFAWCVCAGLPVFMPDIALQNKNPLSAGCLRDFCVANAGI
jgi:hypothetical protein